MLGRKKNISAEKKTISESKIAEKISGLKLGFQHFNLEHKSLVRYAKAGLAVLACAVTVLTINSNMRSSPSIEIYYEGEVIGCTHTKEIFNDARMGAERELAAAHAVAYKFNNDNVTYKIRYDIPERKILNEDEMKTALVQYANGYFTEGFGLYIDNTLVAIGENRSDVTEVLEETIELYGELYARVKTADDIVLFNSKNKIEKISVPKTVVKSKGEIRQVLGLDSLVNLNDILLMDNSLTDDMSVEDISEIFPNLEGITYSDISLGLPAENVYLSAEDDAEEVYAPEASVSFKSSAVETVREVIDCGEKVIEDETLPAGKKVLVESGVYGIKEVTYEVEYIDGVEITRTLIEEKLIKEAVPKTYKVGKKKNTYSANQIYTEVVPGEHPAGASGTFMFPTSGLITSQFSGRNLFGRYEFHGALDIANDAGTPIYAADGGTVVHAAWFSSYGNCIIIDHGNGLQTLYAHLKSYNTKEGDVVGKGWKIAEMGSTGRVTGPHLHFEVRVNDERVDPLNYVTP